MPASKPRSLVVLGRRPDAEMVAQIADGLVPRQDFLEIATATGAEIVSGADLPGWLSGIGWLRCRNKLAAAIAAFFARGRADSIYVTGEDIGLPLALLLRLVGWRGRLVVVVHACQGKSRKLFGWLGPKSFHRLVCVSRTQLDTLREIGFPPDMLVDQSCFADTRFFAPDSSQEGGTLFACGMEQRDYDTLIAASVGLPQRLVILASGMMAADSMGIQSRAAALGADVQVLQRIPFTAVRNCYTAAALVVVPLHPAGYGAGVNGVVEAMAMGKAVVVTNSPGIREYLDPQGMVAVPPHDPAAMHAAIAELMAQPERLAEMGDYNRRKAEALYGIETYVDAMVEIMTR